MPSSTSTSERLRAGAGLLAGVLVFLACCELGLRLLPVSTATLTGYHDDPLILTYPPRHRWTVSTGWDLRNAQELRSNNAGYVAHRDFVPDPRAVALVGDSYVEASMLDEPDRPGLQLERALSGRRPVYALGSPGTALLDYAERIRFARERYGVRDFVVQLETGDLRQALCGSGNVHAQCLDVRSLAPRTETQPAPGRGKRVLRHSALAQYLFSQLKIQPARLWRQAFARQPQTRPTPATSPPASGPGVLSPWLEVVAARFFERVAVHAPGAQLVLVLDADRARLARGEMRSDPDRARFIEIARAAGAQVVDGEPLFREHLRASRLLLDVGPYDAHLNTKGVALLMNAAAASLLSDMSEP